MAEAAPELAADPATAEPNPTSLCKIETHFVPKTGTPDVETLLHIARMESSAMIKTKEMNPININSSLIFVNTSLKPC